MTKSSILQPVTAGLVTAFVGFASSFAVILKGLTAVGASDAQAASGLMALSIAMGLAGIVLSLAFNACRSPRRGRRRAARCWRRPARSTGGFPAAVGAFLVVGVADRRGGPDQTVRPRGGGDSLARSPTRCSPACCSASASQPIKALIEVPRPGGDCDPDLARRLALEAALGDARRRDRRRRSSSASAARAGFDVSRADAATRSGRRRRFSLEAIVQPRAAAVHRHHGLAEPAGPRGAHGLSTTSRRRGR